MKNSVDEFGYRPQKDGKQKEKTRRRDEFRIGSEENKPLPEEYSYRKSAVKKNRQTSERDRTKRLIAMVSMSAVTVISMTFNSITCPNCSGTGIYCPGAPEFGLDRGNAHGYAGCGGTGYSTCPDIFCDDGIRTCEVCLGMGSYYDPSRKGRFPCDRCGGVGYDEDCEFCHGTDRVVCMVLAGHEECTVCGGAGRIRVGEDVQ